MKKHLSILVFAAALLVVVGAGCAKTVVNTNGNTNGTDLTNLPTNTVAAYPYDVTLKIDKGSGATPTTYTQNITQDTTALALLQSISTEKGLKITTKEFDFGTQITSIDGLDQTDKEYWLFYINGQEAPVGAGEYKVQKNDTIEFRFGSGE